MYFKYFGAEAKNVFDDDLICLFIKEVS